MQVSQSQNSEGDDTPAELIPSVLENVDFVKNPAGGNIVKVDVVPEPELEDNTPKDEIPDEPVYHPSNFDVVAQKMLDALREAWNLDPTGEHRAVVVAVTVSQGKIFTVLGDSTEEGRYKNMELWSPAYVEAEVAKTKTAFSENKPPKQS